MQELLIYLITTAISDVFVMSERISIKVKAGLDVETIGGEAIYATNVPVCDIDDLSSTCESMHSWSTNPC